jgi:hypothetical protein
VAAAEDANLAATDLPFFGGDLQNKVKSELRRLSHAPVAEAPLRLDDELTKNILAVVESKGRYAPARLVADLTKRLEASERVDVALDVLIDKDEDREALDLWRRHRSQPHDNGAPVRARQRSLHATLGRCQRRSAEAGARDRRAERRRGEDVRRQGRGEGRFRDSRCHVHSWRSGASAATSRDGPTRSWWLVELSPLALEKVTTAHQKSTKLDAEDAELPRAHVTRWITELPAKSLMPLLADAAKRKSGEGKPIVWNGLAIPVVNAPAREGDSAAQ